MPCLSFINQGTYKGVCDITELVVWEADILNNLDRVMSELLDWYHKNVGE